MSSIREIIVCRAVGNLRSDNGEGFRTDAAPSASMTFQPPGKANVPRRAAEGQSCSSSSGLEVEEFTEAASTSAAFPETLGSPEARRVIF